MRNSLSSYLSAILAVVCIVIVGFLSGCATSVEPEQKVVVSPSKNLGNAELYTFNLAQELFVNLRSDKQHRFAVAGFVPVMSLQADTSQQAPLMLLGHQLEQGLITEAVRRGFVPQDFKASNSLILSSDSDRALSRDLSHLSSANNIDFYITGTITSQQNGAMVNARIINVRNKDVVAAASSFFPNDLFWEQEQVGLRNGMLYRKQLPDSH